VQGFTKPFSTRIPKHALCLLRDEADRGARAGCSLFLYEGTLTGHICDGFQVAGGRDWRKLLILLPENLKASGGARRRRLSREAPGSTMAEMARGGGSGLFEQSRCEHDHSGDA